MKRLRVCTWVIAAAALLMALPASAFAAERFPRGFLWGTATSGFQVEAGGKPSNADRRSDWWAFSNDPDLISRDLVSGDRVDRGPGQWKVWRRDLDLARKKLNNNAVRMGIEWSRIFPRSTAGVKVGSRRITRAQLRRLDRLASGRAVRHYRRVLRGARARGLKTMLTLHHFTLPLWIHDPAGVRAAFAGRGGDDPVPASLRRGGWIQRSTVAEFRKFAAYAAWKFGDHVNLWVTMNEPLVQVSQGMVSIPGVTGTKAPGILSYAAAVQAVEHMALGNAAAYDAINSVDRRARVGFVHNMADWRPANPSSAADRQSAENANYILNRLFLNATVRGRYDIDADGRIDPGEARPEPGAQGRLRGRELLLARVRVQPGRIGEHPRPAVRLRTDDRVPGHGQSRGPALPDPLHRVRLGDRRHRPAQRAGAGRHIRPPAVRDRERHRRRQRQRAAGLPGEPPARGPPGDHRTARACAATSTGRSRTTSSGPRATRRGSACTPSTRRPWRAGRGRAPASTRGSRGATRFLSRRSLVGPLGARLRWCMRPSTAGTEGAGPGRNPRAAGAGRPRASRSGRPCYERDQVVTVDRRFG